PPFGLEIFVTVKRPGRKQSFQTLTSARTRPLWRFLPGPERSWVLWMWQGAFYDTSTNGDSRVGWIVNRGTDNGTPSVFKLEQFRDAFNRQDVIDELMNSHDVAKALEVALGTNPVPVNLGLNEPAALRIELSNEIANGPVKAHLVATARGDNDDFKP